MVEDAFQTSGIATLRPAVARVGSVCNYFLTYTVGPSGMQKGDGISILPPWGGSKIQADDPALPGFVTAETNGDTRLHLDKRCVRTWWYRTTEGDRHIEIWCEILVEVESGGMIAGDTVEITFRDLEAQFTVQQYKIWGVRDYHREWTPRPTPIPRHGPSASYIAAEPARLHFAAPSLVEPGQPFALKLSLLDSFYNPVEEPQPLSLSLSSSNPTQIELPAVDADVDPGSKMAEGGNRLVISPLTVGVPGVFRIQAEVRGTKGTNLRIQGVSNPISAESTGGENIYWGDIHIHTELSDGVGTPEKAYQLARDVYHLDFCALSDHDLQGRRWERACRASSTYNRSGKFVTFPAYEWTSEAFGHRNVYFSSEEDTIDCPPSTADFPVRQLFEYLKARVKGCLVIPHHPLWHMDFTHHDPELERLVEIYSIWGSSEYRSNPLQFLSEKQPGYIRNESARETLARGYQLGFVASGDSHLQYPGDPFPSEKIRPAVTPETEKEGIIFGPGKIAVFAPFLDRDAIWKSMKSRACYATTGARIILRLSVNGHPMGREITIQGTPEITVFAAGTDKIRVVEIIRDGEVIYTVENSPDVVTFTYTDDGFDGQSYYYAKVVQNDGETAWSSPIWVGQG